MKRAIYLLIAIPLILNLAGCDAVQRKFTRKKKEVKRPRIYQLKKYDIKPSPELYEKHFAYYTSWSSEIRDRLGDNHKKDVRCIEELIGQLGDMQNLLVDEKAEELEKHVAQYQSVRDDIVRERIDRYNFSQPMMILEREDRAIKRDFCISRVRNYIRKDWAKPQYEEESAPVMKQVAQATASPAQALPAQPASPAPMAAEGPQGQFSDDDGALVTSSRVVKQVTE